jgi:hypothetical protein
MSVETVALLHASAQLAAGATRIAQVLEHGKPDAWQRLRLRAASGALRAAQAALSEAIGCRPDSEIRTSEVGQ